MKKIGLVTFFTPMNHGARLQAFALQKTIESIGSHCEIINHVPISQRRTSLKARRLSVHRIFNATVELLNQKQLHVEKERFQTFEKYYRLTESLDDILSNQRILDSFDAFVCGSDQIWSRVYEDFYFLDFVRSPRKRIAYAPSFGVSSIRDDERDAYRERLEQFDYLSAREIEGAAIIKELTGKEVPVVLDPTLLLHFSEWRKYKKEPIQPLPDKYILLYAVQNTMPCLKVAKQIQARLKLPIISIDLSKRLAFNPTISSRYDFGPQEWLFAFDHATYVVTSSFHGTAFAINCNKPFLTVCQEISSRKPNTNSRMTTLARLLGLENRLLYSSEQINGESFDCDLSTTFNRLQKERERSLNYLRTALSSVYEFHTDNHNQR